MKAKEYTEEMVGDSYWHPDSARMSKKCFINHLQYFGWLKYKEGEKTEYPGKERSKQKMREELLKYTDWFSKRFDECLNENIVDEYLKPNQ